MREIPAEALFKATALDAVTKGGGWRREAEGRARASSISQAVHQGPAKGSGKKAGSEVG